MSKFKRVNDTYGHFAGDRAIAAVAAQLKRCRGIIGRLGGEEFCLLIDGDLAQAFALAEELRNALMDVRVPVSGSEISLAASFGVAQWEQGDSMDRLLCRADRGCTEQRTRGETASSPKSMRRKRSRPQHGAARFARNPAPHSTRKPQRFRFPDCRNQVLG